MTIQSVYEDLLDEVQQDSLTHLIQSSIGQEAKEDRNKSIAKVSHRFILYIYILS